MNSTNKRYRRTACTGLALALPLVALAACGGGGTEATAEKDSGKGTISVWAHQGQSSEATALQNAVKSFNSSQKKIKVKLKLIPENNYTKTVTTTDPSKLPDVMEFDGPTLASFVYNNKLAPLDKHIAEKTLDNATEASKAQGKINGLHYGLGIYDSGLGIYGNKKLLDAAGVTYPKGVDDAWTAEEFADALEALKAEDSDGKVLDIQENNGLDTEWGTYGFAPILWSAGGGLLKNGEAEGAINSPKAVSAMKSFQSWKRYVDPNTDGNSFVKKRVPLSWVGHWMYPLYSEALGNDLVMLPLPDFGNGPKTGQGSWTWGIGASTENARAAGAFLDHLLNDDNVTAMTKANGAPPATRSTLAASDLYKKGGPLQLFANQLASSCGDIDITSSCVAVTRPVTAGYPTVTENFSKALNSVYGGADPEQALDKAARAIDEDFADNHGYRILP